MIRSRWFWAMNSRGSPWRPAGSRGEEAASAAGFAAFLPLPFAAALATPRPYPSPASVQWLDQQLVLGGTGAEVGHHRHVDQLGEEFLVALDRPVADLDHDRAVDRAGDHLGGAAGDRLRFLELAAAGVDHVGQALQHPVAP